MRPVHAKKALGQHFLTDTDIARRIAATVADYPGPVLEVGPGMGVLTRALIDQGSEVTVVDIDTESIAYMRQAFPQLEARGRIIEADFLKMPLMEMFPEHEHFAVIGNYPYNISSQIFFKVLECKDRIDLCSGMLQREVAERICAAPGSKTRGILSVLLQLWYQCEYLFTVPPEVFDPVPKVNSGVIALHRNEVTDPGCDTALLRTVVKTSFGQRRKTLRNSLRPLLPPDVTLNDHEMGQLRPEQLSVQQFVELTRHIAALRRAQY